MGELCESFEVDLTVDCLWNFISNSVFFYSSCSIFFNIKSSLDSIWPTLPDCKAPWLAGAQLILEVNVDTAVI